MAKGSGGTRGASGGGGGDYSGEFAKDTRTNPFIEKLRAQMLEKTLNSPIFGEKVDILGDIITKAPQIKDERLRQELKDAIVEFDKKIGLPEGYKISLETLPMGRVGYNQVGSIGLSKQVYGRTYKNAENYFKQAGPQRWQIETKNRVVSVLIHEFGHGKYSRLSASGKQQVASVFESFKSSSKTKGWGTYSKTSAEEFYSDAVAKSFLGSGDKWTKALGSIK